MTDPHAPHAASGPAPQQGGVKHGTIVAATDFSPAGRHAAQRAVRLAHETGARVVLLHVVSGPLMEELRRWLGATGEAGTRVLAQAQGQLEQAAQALAQHSHVAVQAHVASGSVPQEVQRQAEACDAALVVVGVRGAGALRRLVLGSTAERLLRGAPRPLLVVRQAPHEPYRRVLVAVDFSPWSLPALQAARQVAPHAELHLLAAVSVPFEEKLRFAGVDEATIALYRRQAHAEAQQRLHALAHDAGLRPGRWTPHVVEGDAWLRIVEQEQELDCDLVVLGRQGRSAAEDLLLGSVTRHVLAEGTVDVLVSTGPGAAAAAGGAAASPPPATG
jgi:nucleotide-binding universal stress UspA family protein